MIALKRKIASHPRDITTHRAASCQPLGADRNVATTHHVPHHSSLTIWGRTGFDGEMSGLWLHAEPNELVKTFNVITANNNLALAA